MPRVDNDLERFNGDKVHHAIQTPRPVPSISGEMRYKVMTTTTAIPITASSTVETIPLELLEHREHVNPPDWTCILDCIPSNLFV